MQTFLVNFVLEPYLKICWDKEVSFKGNVYEFPVDYDNIDKSYILNIHEYLMVKNNIT